MTQDEIIRMAREAGLEQVVAINPKDGGIITKSLSPELLGRFAALVAAHEREQCAKVCDEIGEEAESSQPNRYFDIVAENCAAAIRARNEK